jgi:anaerobic selenocysteine-containing dehydrogenase
VLTFAVLVPNAQVLGTDQFPAPAAQTWSAVAIALGQGLASLESIKLWLIFAGGVVGVLLTFVPVLFPKYQEDLPSASAFGLAAREIKRIKSGCAICPNFCGIEATVVNGIVRTIYPDAARADFYNHGICPKGASGMYNTYDPYRLKKPLKRTNPDKGADQDPRWVEISWEEAFSTIVARLKQIKSEDPRKLIWQHGQGKYLIQEEYCAAFTKAFGTPNMVHRTTACEAARHVADELTWAGAGVLPDLKHSKLLLNFGANYHEASKPRVGSTGRQR